MDELGDEITEKQPAVVKVDVHSKSASPANRAETAECRCQNHRQEGAREKARTVLFGVVENEPWDPWDDSGHEYSINVVTANTGTHSGRSIEHWRVEEKEGKMTIHQRIRQAADANAAE